MVVSTRFRDLTTLAIALAAVGCQTGPTTGPSTAPPAGASFASPAATATAVPQASAAPTEIAASDLPPWNTRLSGGRYTAAELTPRVTFEVEDLAWSVGLRSAGSVELVRAGPGGGTVAVWIARPTSIHAHPDAVVEATTASAAIQTLGTNSALVMIVRDESRMAGLTGTVSVLENPATATSPSGVLRSAEGSVTLDPGHRLWAAFFDTSHGLLAIIVDGPVDGWEDALAAVEPFLESVTIGR